MEQDKLQEEMCYEGRRLYNILNFQDFILEESKKGKKDTKKTKAIVKKRDEFVTIWEMMSLTQTRPLNAS